MAIDRNSSRGFPAAERDARKFRRVFAMSGNRFEEKRIEYLSEVENFCRQIARRRFPTSFASLDRPSPGPGEPSAQRRSAVVIVTVVESMDQVGAKDALALHVYASPDNETGACGYSTFALVHRPPDAEILHVPFGTPIATAFKEVLTMAKQCGIEYVVMNDPAELFPPEIRPAIR
jgi:hypothetical protein